MIPAALDAHPYVHHPHSTRLVSPGLHHLPLQLPLELAPYTSGNCNTEVLPKFKTVWSDDALAGRAGGRSREIIFANTDVYASEMGADLFENCVLNIVVTGQSCGTRALLEKAPRGVPLALARGGIPAQSRKRGGRLCAVC